MRPQEVCQAKFLVSDHDRNAIIYPHYSARAMVVRIRSKFVFEMFKSFGFPAGHKNPTLMIPEKLSIAPNRYLRKLVKGLVDTDGCVFAKRRENYRYPHLKDNVLQSEIKKAT